MKTFLLYALIIAIIVVGFITIFSDMPLLLHKTLNYLKAVFIFYVLYMIYKSFQTPKKK